MVNVTEDNHLWDRFRKGDVTAFSHIYELHVQALYQYGMKLSSDSAFVMDCIHDLFVDLNHHHKTIEVINNMRSYLIRSLRNRIFRSLKSRDRTGYDAIENHPFLLEAAFDEQLDELETTRKKRRRLREALNKLPDRQKEVIYLRYINGLSNEEIVQIMGINYQAVRNTLHKAIENLRKTISMEDLILFLLSCQKKLRKKI